ncbi:MAG: protocatechuate 3,4-dioxygenase [Gammaproteobacteria bacterium]|nr:protocatechuate 3,4-dioxygenase [Gammaproteobacteria bacterium]
MQRRIFLLSALFAGITQRLQAALQPTPSQGEGPFYPVQPIPLDNDLVHHAGGTAAGEHLELSGIVRDTAGKPLADALIEIWQCDAAGYYRHPRASSDRVDRHFAGFGAMRTSATGAYHFSTLMPVPYTGRPPHIHVKIHGANREYLTSQIYLQGKTKEGGVFGLFSGDRGNLTIDPVSSSGNVKQARFDFVIERAA